MASSGMAGHELSPKQLRAIQALMTAGSIAEAAKVAGCGERSLYRWMKDPVFLAGVQDATKQAIDATIRRMASLSVAAVGVLARVMSDPDAAPGVKAHAADRLLARMPDWRQLEQLEQRLSAIEAALLGDTHAKP